MRHARASGLPPSSPSARRKSKHLSPRISFLRCLAISRNKSKRFGRKYVKQLQRSTFWERYHLRRWLRRERSTRSLKRGGQGIWKEVKERTLQRCQRTQNLSLRRLWKRLKSLSNTLHQGTSFRQKYFRRGKLLLSILKDRLSRAT